MILAQNMVRCTKKSFVSVEQFISGAVLLNVASYRSGGCVISFLLRRAEINKCME
jgi:hypothetical protein